MNKKNKDSTNLSVAKQQAESAKFALDQHSLVSITDLEGIIVYVNDKFIDISGYHESELLGKKHNVLNSNNQPKSYWKKMHQTILSGKVWHDEVRNRAKNGHYYWVDTTIVPNFDSDKKVIGFTSIRTDITQQKDNIAKLALAKEQAEVANISKADFLANMSHEIRTPMNGVIGMINLLIEHELNAEQLKIANIIKSSAVGLLTIINDILDFSKVDAGKLTLEFTPFDLGKMLEELGATMGFLAQDKHLELICPAYPVIDQWITGDSGRIRQILTNLIGNAIKFTDTGHIAIYVKQIEETADKKVFHFEVIDTGIGIEQSKQSQLFEQFSQSDNSTTRKYGGTGLGLSISKKIVELMGGTIGIEQTLLKGSTFWFTLPFSKSEILNKVTTIPDELKKEKVIFVDTNKHNHNFMEKLHQIWGIKYKSADSIESALNQLKIASDINEPITIAIIDNSLLETKQMNNKKQLNYSQLEQINLIISSSQNRRFDDNKTKELGVKGQITKPFKHLEILNELIKVSGIKTRQASQTLNALPIKKQQFNAHILVTEDNRVNQLVIRGLLIGLGITVDLACNGKEAISALGNGNTYDLIFMDCQMPVLDGYEATKQIRLKTFDNNNTKLPIIAITANAMIGDRKKCLDSGMNDYLTKPLDPQKVIDILKKWLPNKCFI
ncbi:PAS domain-containing hybrid sensor histidine kinase/response regulator [Thalassotalea profundi]|nr:PAS domain-containing hybrid sensor histidine kinase/response regulator [Thalassotalea profundi]